MQDYVVSVFIRLRTSLVQSTCAREGGCQSPVCVAGAGWGTVCEVPLVSASPSRPAPSDPPVETGQPLIRHTEHTANHGIIYIAHLRAFPSTGHLRAFPSTGDFRAFPSTGECIDNVFLGVIFGKPQMHLMQTGVIPKCCKMFFF